MRIPSPYQGFDTKKLALLPLNSIIFSLYFN